MSKNLPLDTLVLCILDGWGIGQGDMEATGDAIRLASKIGRTPNWDRLCKESLISQLQTSGESVGLPAGQMGNSEVGHMHIGAGRVVKQSLTRINEAIESGEFYRNEGLEAFAKEVKDTVHVAGIVSSGGVHGSMEHVLETLKFFHGKGLQVKLHAFLDGRDAPPQAALEELSRFLIECEKAGLGEDVFATIMGRYYAMDRDKRWGRTNRAFCAMEFGEGWRVGRGGEGLEEALAKNYKDDESDEFIPPRIFGDYAGFAKEDALFFTNFRDDRMLQLAMYCAGDDSVKLRDDLSFVAYDRHRPHPIGSMMPYHERREAFEDFDSMGLMIPYGIGTVFKNFYVAFPKQPLRETLGECIAQVGWKQLRLAESEKYPHVTYFFNGGREGAFGSEKCILVDSPKVATYDLKPYMSISEVALFFCLNFLQEDFSLFVLNYANPDMVGHTGKLEETIEAIAATDTALGILDRAIRDSSKKTGLMIFADHGNAEQMLDAKGGPHTMHTTNLVPLVVTGSVSAGLNKESFDLSGGSLIDIAPTALRLLGLEQPAVMTGRSLLKEKE